MADRLAETTPVAEIDRIDLQLLQLLTEDGRASLKKLADHVGLSSPSVSDRLERLTAKGVIRGYKVEIDWDALGYSTVAYLLIKTQAGQDKAETMLQLEQTVGVEEISIVAGSTDMLVKVRATGFEDLRRLLVEKVWAMDGLQTTESLIAFFSIPARTTTNGLLEKMMATKPQPEPVG